jgi:hypothetical protein
MLSSIWGLVSRRSRVVAAAAALAVTALAGGSAAQAADEMKPAEVRPGSAYELAFSTTTTSHFISYGADVWGGGNELSPFSARSTVFTEGTLTAKFADQLKGFVNVWSDNNDNVTSGIGGPIQEVDVNAGVIYDVGGGFTVKGVVGFWEYASDEEGIADLVIQYSDGDKIIPGFSINPSIKAHYRFKGNGSQETGLAVVAGISPSITLNKESPYKITVGFPAEVAYFQDGFQGGDSGLGFVDVGVTVSVPLAFIPAKYGNWAFTASATYFYTPEDQIPNNPRENFIVTAMSIGVGF